MWFLIGKPWKLRVQTLVTKKLDAEVEWSAAELPAEPDEDWAGGLDCLEILGTS